jgi:hypothetical protein
MKLNPKEIQETTTDWSGFSPLTRLSLIWERYWEIIIAVVAALIVSLLLLMIR